MACGTETVRKTVPLGLVLIVVVVVLPFNRGLPVGCTSVTLMGVILPGVPMERFCMALWAPLLLLVSKLVPACITGAAVTVAAVVVMALLTACECLYRDVFAGSGAGSVKAYGSSWTRDAC